MFLAMLGCIVPPTEARGLQVLTYQLLFERSDLVVVATPFRQTVDTQEDYTLPGIATIDANGIEREVKCIGVESAFRISAVLKGHTTAQELILHHYRDKASVPPANGAELVWFDGSPSSYLLFLIREPDGRYAPTGGQVDPGFNAITRLPNVDPGLNSR
jgi:hypothetical protein